MMAVPQVRVHLTPMEKQKLEIAAALVGASHNRSFAHDTMMARVEEILREHQIQLPKEVKE